MEPDELRLFLGANERQDSDGDNEFRDDSSMSDILHEFNPEAGMEGGLEFYAPRLSKTEAEEIYRDWLGRRIVSSYAIEATRKWTVFKPGGDDSEKTAEQIKAFNEYEHRKGFSLRSLFRQADTWSNLYGAAVIVLGIDDGRPADQPVNKDNIRHIAFGKVLDRYRIAPDLTYNNDPEDVTHYRLVYDHITASKLKKLKMSNGRTFSDYRIHRDRCLVFEAYENPPDIALRNMDGWSDSLLSSVWSDMENYYDSNGTVSKMLKEHSLLLYKMQGYKSALSNIKVAGKEQIRANFRNMRTMMKLFNALVIDKDDDISNVTKQYAGVADLMDRFANRLVAATDIPYTQLFGRGPQGLASAGTGATEDNVWEKKVAGYQAMHYRPLLDVAYDYVLRAKEGPTGGEVPEGWSYDFVSLEVKNMSTEAATRSAIASADNIYFGMGAVTKEELRNSRFSGEYSIEVNLDEEEWERLKKEEEEASKAEEEAAAQQQQGLGAGGEEVGFGSYGDYLPPDEGEPINNNFLQQDSLIEVAQRKFQPNPKYAPFVQLWLDSINEPKKV
jgi:phage-related protein (TIGR01555 family)